MPNLCMKDEKCIKKYPKHLLKRHKLEMMLILYVGGDLQKTCTRGFTVKRKIHSNTEIEINHR